MSKLLLFRLSMIALIIVCFLSSYEMKDYADVMIMGFAVMFSISYIVAEIISAGKAE